MDSIIGVIVLTLISSTKMLVNADKECKESRATAEKVNLCPRTAKEWNEAAARKGCGNITHSCSSFEYHCVLNAWRNETIEVCAARWNIVGMSCAEYNFGGKRIQKSKDGTCNACPTTYLSTESFKYQECYNYVIDIKRIPEYQGTTESAINNSRIPEHNTSSLPTVLKQGVNYRHTNSENTPSVLIVIFACVVAGVLVLVIAMLMVNKSRRNLLCSKIYRLVLNVEENTVSLGNIKECSTTVTNAIMEEERGHLTEVSNNQEIC